MEEVRHRLELLEEDHQRFRFQWWNMDAEVMMTTMIDNLLAKAETNLLPIRVLKTNQCGVLGTDSRMVLRLAMKYSPIAADRQFTKKSNNKLYK